MKSVATLLAAAALIAPTLAGAATVVLKEGTEVRVATRTELSSKTANVGDPVDLVVDEPVQVNGVTAIPAGTRVTGEVSQAEKNGHLGKSGKLNIDVRYIKYGDGQIRVRGQRTNEGGSGTGATIATTVLLGPLGLLVHGKSAVIPPNTKMTVYVDQDVTMMVDEKTANGPVIHASTN